MSKKERNTFVLMNIANYILVLLTAVFYQQMGLFLYPVMLLTQTLLTGLNCVIAKKPRHLSILSLNLLLSTIISHIVGIILYMQSFPGDTEMLLVGKYAVAIGSIYVIIISLTVIVIKFVIATVIKFSINKSKSKTE